MGPGQIDKAFTGGLTSMPVEPDRGKAIVPT
jgi:hypothetical protein